MGMAGVDWVGLVRWRCSILVYVFIVRYATKQSRDTCDHYTFTTQA